MNTTVTIESLDQIELYQHDERIKICWEPLFLLPVWLKVWVQSFPPDGEIQHLVVRVGDEVIGIAPLLINSGTASILGSVNVCDYFDFPLVPGKESVFYTTLLEYLRGKGIKTLDARVIRPDSTIVNHLLPMADTCSFKVDLQPDELSPTMPLPATWEEYLHSLDSKQRHEVRRKIRRIEAAGAIRSRNVTSHEDIPLFLEIFFKMFVTSREAKAHFLTGEIETYFRNLVQATADAGLLHGFILELDQQPVAGLVAFDYQDTVYLYNSGFDRHYDSLSVGIISKVYLIKDSIERGKKRFDFLKGGEPYKFHLGGQELRLMKCRIMIG